MATLVRNAHYQGYLGTCKELSIPAGRHNQRRVPVPLPTMVLVFAATLSFTHLLQKHVPLYSQSSTRAFGSSFLVNRESGSVFPLAVACHAKKKPNFFDQILDYIEGGYFLDILHFFLFLKSCFLLFFFNRFSQFCLLPLVFLVHFQGVPN